MKKFLAILGFAIVTTVSAAAAELPPIDGFSDTWKIWEQGSCVSKNGDRLGMIAYTSPSAEQGRQYVYMIEKNDDRVVQMVIRVFPEGTIRNTITDILDGDTVTTFHPTEGKTEEILDSIDAAIKAII